MDEGSRRPARRIKETDHLVPVANRLLGVAVRMAWGMAKLMGRAAMRIPGMFVRVGRRYDARKGKGERD